MNNCALLHPWDFLLDICGETRSSLTVLSLMGFVDIVLDPLCRVWLSGEMLRIMRLLLDFACTLMFYTYHRQHSSVNIGCKNSDVS